MNCPTCGKDRATVPGRECSPCASRWERARKSRAFLPTVDMFPPAPRPGCPGKGPDWPAGSPCCFVVASSHGPRCLYCGADEPRQAPPARPVRGSQLDAFDLDLFGG